MEKNPNLLKLQETPIYSKSELMNLLPREDTTHWVWSAWYTFALSGTCNSTMAETTELYTLVQAENSGGRECNRLHHLKKEFFSHKTKSNLKNTRTKKKTQSSWALQNQ